jgi:L-aspartate oxidase
VHGANRLASNSLLEGLVFSRRIASVLPQELRPPSDPAPETRDAGLVSAEVRPHLQAVMTERVGVLRSADGLEAALTELAALAGKDGELGTRAWEASNLVTISTALAEAALVRRETRGSHWREDFPERDDAEFAGHLDVVLEDGCAVVTFRPAAVTDGGAT